jgi:hypothetical protein
MSVGPAALQPAEPPAREAAAEPAAPPAPGNGGLSKANTFLEAIRAWLSLGRSMRLTCGGHS